MLQKMHAHCIWTLKLSTTLRKLITEDWFMFVLNNEEHQEFNKVSSAYWWWWVVRSYTETAGFDVYTLGSIDVDCGTKLYGDLSSAQQSIVLANYLHLLYLVTPYDMVAVAQTPRWMTYLREVSMVYLRIFLSVTSFLYFILNCA